MERDERTLDLTRIDTSQEGTNGTDGSLINTQELPNWAKRALSSPPIKTDVQSREEQSDESDTPHSPTLNSLSPTPDLSSLPLDIPPHDSTNHRTAQERSTKNIHQLSIHTHNSIFPKKTAYLRPWSELSLPAYPTINMDYSAGHTPQGTFNSPRECSCCADSTSCYSAASAYSNNFNKTFHNKIMENNGGFYQNSQTHFVDPSYYSRSANPINASLGFFPGHDPTTYSAMAGGYPQPYRHQNRHLYDNLLISQGRPLMSSQQNRMFIPPAHHLYHSFQHNTSSMSGMPGCYIPISIHHGQGNMCDFPQNPPTYKTGTPSPYSPGVGAGHAPPNFDSQGHEAYEQGEGSFQNDLDLNVERHNRSVPSNELPLDFVQSAPNLNISASHDIASSVNSTVSKSESSEVERTSQCSNNLIKENKIDKKENFCESETISQPVKANLQELSPKPALKETQSSGLPVTSEKDERFPVAYTILFSPKDDVAKPPELSDRRAFMRVRSQERTALPNKFSEAARPNTNLNSRSSSAKVKTDKIISGNRERIPRRSRESNKSVSTEAPLNPESRTISHSTEQPSSGPTASLGTSKTTNQKTNYSKVSPKLKKQREVKESAANDSDCDAVSECGTYVIGSESSGVRSQRENIPNVFGINVDDLTSMTQSDTRMNKKPKAARHRSLGSSIVCDQKSSLREISLEKETSSSYEQQAFNSSRRLLPEAPGPANAQEKIVIKGKPPLSEGYESIAKWLARSVVPSNKYPSEVDEHPTRSMLNFEPDKTYAVSSHQSRRSERLMQNLCNKSSPPTALVYKDDSKRDATPHKEFSGRRSVDPLLTSVRSRVARLNKNTSLCDNDEGSSSWQMSKSLISNNGLHLNGSPIMGRPTRPRSTSRPRASKGNSARRPGDWLHDSLNDSKSGTDMDASPHSTVSKQKLTVSERLCAPTISTELKSKKTSSNREPTPIAQIQSSAHAAPRGQSVEEVTPSVTSLQGFKKKFLRSRATDVESTTSQDSDKVGGVKEAKAGVTRIEASSSSAEEISEFNSVENVSDKMAKLIENLVKDSEGLLEEASYDASRSSTAMIDTTITHLREGHVTNESLLTAISNLLKLQECSQDKNLKVPIKKYRETTF